MLNTLKCHLCPSLLASCSCFCMSYFQFLWRCGPLRPLYRTLSLPLLQVASVMPSFHPMAVLPHSPPLCSHALRWHSSSIFACSISISWAAAWQPKDASLQSCFSCPISEHWQAYSSGPLDISPWLSSAISVACGDVSVLWFYATRTRRSVLCARRRRTWWPQLVRSRKSAFPRTIRRSQWTTWLCRECKL